MRWWTGLLLLALVGLLTPPVVASHTTRTTLEIDMGESFDLLQRAGELIDVVADPPGILEIRQGGKLRVEAQCVRVGKTIVTIRYGAGGEVHTSIIAVTCKEKEK